MKQFSKILASSLVSLFIAACGSSDDVSRTAGLNTAAGCSAGEVRDWAYENLQDYYLFYDQVPVVNTANYASAATLVEALRVLPFDRFSRVATTSIEEEIFEQGKTFGLGAVWQWDEANRLKVAAVHRESPLGLAGITRGDELTLLQGVAPTVLTDELYNQFVGTRDNPATSNWTFKKPGGSSEITVSVTPAVYKMNTVLHTQTISFAHFNEKIGYLALDSFLGTTESELDAAIAKFRRDGVKELVLDLRYNGGGLVSVATKLASQIAGPSTDGKMLMEYRHNDKYSEFDFSLDFENVEDNLNLSRLVVLTSEYTASASEIVISALSPYIEVVTIGSRTTGKPYISFGNDYCGQSLHALQAEGFNAGNVSVYGGIAPSCGARDDLNADFGWFWPGENTESMLSAALHYLVYGVCNTPELAATAALQNDSPQQNSLINGFAHSRIEGGARIDRSAKM